MSAQETPLVKTPHLGHRRPAGLGAGTGLALAERA